MPSGLDVPDWLRVDGPPPTLDEGEKGQRHAATAVYVAIGFTALYLLYFSSARLARGGASLLGLAIVAAGAVTFQALAVVAPYSLSSDVFSYAIYGRIFAIYGGSPYLEAPIRYSSDPFYPFVYWMHVPSFYGPLWTLISGWVALAADGDDRNGDSPVSADSGRLRPRCWRRRLPAPPACRSRAGACRHDPGHLVPAGRRRERPQRPQRRADGFSDRRRNGVGLDWQADPRNLVGRRCRAGGARQS